MECPTAPVKQNKAINRIKEMDRERITVTSSCPVANLPVRRKLLPEFNSVQNFVFEDIDINRAFYF